MKKEELLNTPISFYRNMRSTKVIQTTVEKVLNAIEGPFYETQVKTIRHLKARGKQAEADEVKGNLHAVTFCATFEGRRLSSLYHTYNSLMVIDIDKLPEELCGMFSCF